MACLAIRFYGPFVAISVAIGRFNVWRALSNYWGLQYFTKLCRHVGALQLPQLRGYLISVNVALFRNRLGLCKK